jgi:hypothetical protein
MDGLRMIFGHLRSVKGRTAETGNAHHGKGRRPRKRAGRERCVRSEGRGGVSAGSGTMAVRRGRQPHPRHRLRSRSRACAARDHHGPSSVSTSWSLPDSPVEPEHGPADHHDGQGRQEDRPLPPLPLRLRCELEPEPAGAGDVAARAGALNGVAMAAKTALDVRRGAEQANSDPGGLRAGPKAGAIRH